MQLTATRQFGSNGCSDVAARRRTFTHAGVRILQLGAAHQFQHGSGEERSFYILVGSVARTLNAPLNLAGKHQFGAMQCTLAQAALRYWFECGWPGLVLRRIATDAAMGDTGASTAARYDPPRMVPYDTVSA